METGQSNQEFLEQFRNKIGLARVPISGTLELTSRCNLRCVHCYLGPQEVQHQKRSQELTTDEAKSLIDEFADAGCLNLLITGGDPMMRKDFSEIYRHAKLRGLLITIFCDGVLVTEKIVELFKDLPPSYVEISIYGATEETYETITRVKGSYKKCIAGVERLLAAGIRTRLKTVLMTLNKHEFEQMEDIARLYNVQFRFDAAIFPCLPNGDKAPLDLRVSPQEAIDKEMSDPARLKSWKEYYDERRNMPKSDKLYKCGAGLTGFYVDPFGAVSPCLMTTKYRYDARNSSFKERWQNDIGQLREKKANTQNGCSSCQMQAACAGCPAFFDLEMGTEQVKSDYVCETTKLRLKVITAA